MARTQFMNMNSDQDKLENCCIENTRVFDQLTRLKMSQCIDKASFKISLENLVHGSWKVIASYESDCSADAVRYLNSCNGPSQSFNVNLPKQVIYQLAINDFVRNKNMYSIEYEKSCGALVGEGR